MWQQQMQLMETFHNDMVMMVQMFIAMHREFQASVRDELAQVQKLTKELGRLNAKLGLSPERDEAGAVSKADRAAPKARAAPRSAPPAPKPSARADAKAAAAPSGEKQTEPKDKQRPTGRSPKISSDHKETAPGPETRLDAPDMYADLTRRITQLQRERRGYWQRILKSING